MPAKYFVMVILFVSSLTKGSCQVNLQTGAAQVNLSLYSYNDPGSRLGTSASLNYFDGNGLKASESASSVGTGWTLDCGGVIVRTQHGVADDQKQNGIFNYPQQLYTDQDKTDYSNYAFNYYPNGYMYSEYNPADQITDEATFTPFEQSLPVNARIFKPNPKYIADLEQDIFSFSFNGRSGQFVIGKNKQARILNDSKLKVDIVESNMTASNIRTTISQFTITDEQGIQYVFNQLELGYILVYDSIYSYDVNGNLSSKFLGPYHGSPLGYLVYKADAKNSFVVNKWYLSQIINPFNNKAINFHYEDYEVDIDGDKFIDYSVINNQDNLNITWDKHKVKAKRLISVDLSALERIECLYSSSTRKDISCEKYLSSLQVKFNNSIVYSWNLNYAYIIGSPIATKQVDENLTALEALDSRLFLISVQKIGTSGFSKEPPTQFTYNMGGDNAANLDRIPRMYSLFQDHFGYYNAGKVWFANEPGPDQLNSKSDIISYVKFLASQNYKDPNSTVSKNGIIKSVTYPLGGTLTFEYESNNVLYNSQTLQSGGVRVSKTSLYDGSDHTKDIIKEYKYITSSGQTSGWGYEPCDYHRTMPMSAVSCSGNNIPGLNLSELSSNYVSNYFMTAAPGSSFSAISYSSLFGMAVSLCVSGILANVINIDPSVQQYSIDDYSNVSSVYSNPIPMSYSRVEVVNRLLTGNTGKTVYEFSDPSNHSLEIPVLNTPFSARQRYASWVYGLPKTVTVFDKDNNIITQNVNVYNYIVNPLSDNNYLSRSWTSLKNNYGCFFQIYSPTTANISQETYYPLTGRTELTQSTALFFDANHQSSVTTTNFEYDQNYQLNHKYFNNSKNELIETFYKHLYDYNIAGPVNILNDPNKNVIGPIISSETYIKKSDNNSYLIDGSSSDFSVLANGDVKPSNLYALQTASPVISSSLPSFNNGQIVRDASYFKLTSSLNYDVNGNLCQIISDGNKTESNIYDYAGKYIIATVTNATYNSIAYSSFESDGFGGWTINPGGTIVSTEAVTGTKSFSGTLSKTVPSGNYSVTLWVNSSGNVTVNGQSGSLIITNGSWQLRSWAINSATTITIVGTRIDEVRLYPVGAMMKTFTYLPLIGKSSECDFNNRITYYEYDDMGRLRNVKDENGNILRMYEYNYKK